MLLGFAACGSGDAPTTTPPVAAARPKVVPVARPEVVPVAREGEWSAANADDANSRSVRGPIDSSSVGHLETAWKLAVGPYVATPVVVDNVLYTQDLTSTVYAVDVRTGTLRWKKVYAEPTIGPNGVAVAEGRVYGATTTKVFALDARSGRQLWIKRIAFKDGEGTDMSPGVHDGTVYVSTVPVTPQAVYVPGVRGILWALDAATGREQWTWATVPVDLWGDKEHNSGGGLWYTPAFDQEQGVYLSIGNPAPFSSEGETAWGKSRPGPNKWTDSIVKLNTETGKMVWGRQVLPHDVYDWDLEAPVILRRVAGREVAVVGGKMGIVYGFDRESGALLWRRAVGKHNGHDNDNLAAMHGKLKNFPEGTRLLPGVYGGIETPMAADETTVYAPVDNQYSVLSGERMISNQPFEEATGEIVAVSLADGHIRWARKLPHAVFGGATVANDIVFTTTYEGTVWALRTDTGTIAWRATLPFETTSPVAVAGDTLITAASGSYGSDATVIAYRLGG